MSHSYTKEQFLSELKKIKPELLYKCNQVNYKGKTKNTREYYTEVFAEYLLENLKLLQDLPIHKRKLDYRISAHVNREVPGEESNRHEEKIAIQLYRQFRDSEKSPFGRVLDYQVPLKESRADEAGKIDLLSVKGNEVMVLELKIPNSKETMLRCALEAYTYYKTVDSDKLLKEYDLSNKGYKLVPTPLLFIGGDQQIEYESSDHSKLRELMSKLGIVPLFIPEDLIKK